MIAWADHTYNHWIGCTQVSRACDACYAKADFQDRRHRVSWGPGQPRSRTKTQGDLLRWNRGHEAFFAAHGRRQSVFLNSLSDPFDNEVADAWRNQLWDLCDLTPNLDKLADEGMTFFSFYAVESDAIFVKRDVTSLCINEEHSTAFVVYENVLIWVVISCIFLRCPVD